MTFNRVFCVLCWFNVLVSIGTYNWIGAGGWVIAASYITKDYWNK